MPLSIIVTHFLRETFSIQALIFSENVIFISIFNINIYSKERKYMSFYGKLNAKTVLKSLKHS